MNPISVEQEDVLTTACDVLVLKHAQTYYGADAAVAAALGLSESENLDLAPGKYGSIPAGGKLVCKRVLFLGVGSLGDFGYAEIRKFSKDALTILAHADYERDSIAMTMHGAGYGLDEREAFNAQVAGLLEYLASPENGWRPKHISIVEWDANRAQRLSALLAQILPEAGNATPGSAPRKSMQASIPDAGVASDLKQRIFVAMPYTDEMEDVFEFGIKEPFQAAGYLCEGYPPSAYIGDVMEKIKRYIESATVVVAEMTGSNPNVYLEVGYAWGKGVRTLLVARKGEKLGFDLETHTCIFYKTVKDLNSQLVEFLPLLNAQS